MYSLTDGGMLVNYSSDIRLFSRLYTKPFDYVISSQVLLVPQKKKIVSRFQVHVRANLTLQSIRIVSSVFIVHHCTCRVIQFNAALPPAAGVREVERLTEILSKWENYV